ncbi:Rrf2 family transcriptional regulator [Clostridium sp.]|uniref:RrF2 family transcriptional regulator n=1 Tax=Clostridium sp. TaxID=1506 RepID=UPI002909E2CE|nr:Rrf2 family transcriptional regulator [Clostridium sp.]MDU6522155.1 Rrf2 family transcriptional regulator [Clostridium sp.]
MQLNITTDYAIRIVLYLAIKEKLTTSKEISEVMFIPESYINKIMRKLRAAGIINTYNGAKGGYDLKKNPDEISLLDIVKTMENTIRFNRCLEVDGYCSRQATKTCSVHKYYKVIQSEIETRLEKITIRDCMK